MAFKGPFQPKLFYDSVTILVPPSLLCLQYSFLGKERNKRERPTTASKDLTNIRISLFPLTFQRPYNVTKKGENVMGKKTAKPVRMCSYMHYLG